MPTPLTAQNIQQLNRIGMMNAHRQQPTHLAYHPGSQIVGSSNMWEMYVWEINSNAVREHRLPMTNTISFSPDGKYVATQSTDPATRASGVIVYDMPSGKVVKVLQQRSLVGVAFNPQGNTLILCDLGTVTVIQLETWETIHEIKMNAEIKAFALHPDGTQIALYRTLGARNRDDLDQDIWVMRLSGEEIKTLPAPMLKHLHFSPDGKYLVTANRIWHTSTWQEKHKLMGFAKLVFNQNGTLIAAHQSASNKLSFLDAETFAELKVLEHADPIGDFVFSLDGTRVAVSTGPSGFHNSKASGEPGAGAVHVWQIPE